MCSRNDDPSEITAFEDEYLDQMAKAEVNRMREWGWSVGWVNDSVTAIKNNDGPTYTLNSSGGWVDALSKMYQLVRTWEGR
jgi:hypothetical protein